MYYMIIEKNFGVTTFQHKPLFSHTGIIILFTLVNILFEYAYKNWNFFFYLDLPELECLYF